MDNLICTYLTHAGAVQPFDPNPVSPHSLELRAAACARAGYAGMGFFLADYQHIRQTHSVAEIRSILDTHDIRLRELEVLTDWFSDGERRAASDRVREQLLQAASEIGARHIKIVGDLTGRPWPMDVLVEAFASLCAEARAHGTAITIELLPTTNLADLQTGFAVVDGAGSENGGLLLDSWHMIRGNINFEAITSLPASAINHVELDDGDLYPRSGYLDDTINCRKFPGEGQFPLADFLAAIQATGYDGTYGVEVLSRETRNLPVEDVIARSTAGILPLFSR